MPTNLTAKERLDELREIILTIVMLNRRINHYDNILKHSLDINYFTTLNKENGSGLELYNFSIKLSDLSIKIQSALENHQWKESIILEDQLLKITHHKVIYASTLVILKKELENELTNLNHKMNMACHLSSLQNIICNGPDEYILSLAAQINELNYKFTTLEKDIIHYMQKVKASYTEKHSLAISSRNSMQSSIIGIYKWFDENINLLDELDKEAYKKLKMIDVGEILVEVSKVLPQLCSIAESIQACENEFKYNFIKIKAIHNHNLTPLGNYQRCHGLSFEIVDYRININLLSLSLQKALKKVHQWEHIPNYIDSYRLQKLEYCLQLELKKPDLSEANKAYLNEIMNLLKESVRICLNIKLPQLEQEQSDISNKLNIYKDKVVELNNWLMQKATYLTEENKTTWNIFMQLPSTILKEITTAQAQHNLDNSVTSCKLVPF